MELSSPFKDARDSFLFSQALIDLLAILQKSLDRAVFLYDFIREAR